LYFVNRKHIGTTTREPLCLKREAEGAGVAVPINQDGTMRP